MTGPVRQFARVAAILALAAVGGAGLVAISGAPSMSAARGHWSITQTLLEFTKRRSIATHAMRVTPPQLGDRALVTRGAGHYVTACRQCHGVPGEGAPMMLREMLPHPPDLLRVSERYSARELFQIVKHGLKLGGMPGWPAQDRDDEVWAMVALLQALPSLGRDGFVRLSAPQMDPTADAPAVVTTVCARCHGLDGVGPVAGAVPKLAGQRPAYLYQTLKAFSVGSRLSGIMTPIAEPLADQEMMAAAGYYSALSGLTPLAVNSDDLQAPRCTACHAQSDAVNATYPLIGGQYPNYVALQLTLFAERRRGGTAFAPLMHQPADRLTEEQRWQLAHALARLR